MGELNKNNQKNQMPPGQQQASFDQTKTSQTKTSQTKTSQTKSEKAKPTALAYNQVYGCPACGSGELSTMAMMDLFACDFCRHMFTANLQTQSVQLADSLQPMAWRWTGWQWRAAHQADTAAAIVWTFAIGLMIVPVALISLSNYIFPPSGGLKFVIAWVTLTGLSHGIISGWLLAEYHRWPWYVASRIRLQRWKEQWAT